MVFPDPKITYEVLNILFLYISLLTLIYLIFPRADRDRRLIVLH